MITIKNLSVRFKNEEIYRDFSLNVKKGEKWAVTGESGKGKSTLLNVISGFIPDFSGSVTVNGLAVNPRNICDIRKNTSWLPQETALNLMTVKMLFETPFNFALNKKNKPSPEEISSIFSAFSLDESLMKKKVKQISGGQKQRVLLASAVLQKKPLLLLDEPSSALDKRIRKQVTDYILEMEGVTILAVTHDEYWMERSDHILNLDEGRQS